MAKVLGNQQAQPKIDLSQAKDMNCIHCNNSYFIQAVMVKKISRFVTGTANDAVLPVDVLLCGNCGKPFEELLPKEFRKHTKPTEEQEQTPQIPTNTGVSIQTDNTKDTPPTPGKLILEP
jgi:5-methylcytosine-specific restriction endonuclease McrA